LREVEMRGKPRAKPDGSRIAAVSVCGYKSIVEKRRIELRPLTLLAGANSSGKSSMMQPLLLLKQTLEASYDPGPLLLNGPNVRFTSVDQLLSRVKGGACSSEFSVGLEAGDGSSVELRFSRSEERGFDIRSMEYSYGQKEAGTLFPGMTEEQIRRFLPPGTRQTYELMAKMQGATMQWKVVRNRCLLYVYWDMRSPESGAVEDVAMLPVHLPDAAIRSVIHLPGLRGNPERTYPTTAVAGDFPGEFQKYVASIVSQWQDSKEKTDFKKLAANLEELGLTWKVEAKRVDDTQVELLVGRLPRGQRGGARDLVNIVDVGFGVSQTLPVLVALLVAKPGQLVYLEQPELHLHPRAQTRLASVLAEAARRGVIVVAETHSALLLRSVQTLVAESELSPDLVKLHWFRRRDEDGATEVDSSDLDDRGRFAEEWPEDFDNVALKAEADYLDAVEAHR
jgi:hypothetical protein